MPFGDIDDPDRYLYHYTTTSAALGNILPSGLIRLGLARYTNDPRETKAWRFDLRGGDGSKLVAINKEATDLLQRTSKLLCLTRDDPEQAVGSDLEAIFGRGFAHSSMWAHYAGGHSGVCLVFDRLELHRQIIDECRKHPDWGLYAGQVTYKDYDSDEIDAFFLDGDRIEADGLEVAVNDHFEVWHPILFFRKNTDWGDEFEFRWLLRDADAAPAFVPIGNALCGIVAGDKFPSAEGDSLRYLADRLRGGPMPIVSCKWNNGYPDLIAWGGGGIIMRHKTWAKGAIHPPPPPSLSVPCH